MNNLIFLLQNCVNIAYTGCMCPSEGLSMHFGIILIEYSTFFGQTDIKYLQINWFPGTRQL